MDLTRQGHDGAEDPIKTNHPEEEEHHENGASKMLRKVKARARKIKNSLTKHEQDPDVDEEDDESDKQSPKAHESPVYESSAVRDGETGQPESLSHASETNLPAPEEIIPVVSSDYTRPVETVSFQEGSYGHEAPPHPVREAPSPPSGMSYREENKEALHEPMTTSVPLLCTTEDVKRTSNYQSKVTDPTHEGGRETAVPEIDGSMKVTDESHDQKSRLGIETDFPTRIQEFDRNTEFETGKESPVARESGAEPGKDFPTRSFESDQKTESGIDEDSLTRCGGKPETGLSEDVPAKSHEFEQKVESRIGEDSEFGGKPGNEQSVDFLVKSYEFDHEIESGIGKNSLTGSEGDYPARSHELGLKNDSGIGKDLPKVNHGYGKDFPAKIESGINDDTRCGGRPGTKQSVDFLATSYEFDQEIDSGIGKESPTNFEGESEAGLRGDSGIGKDSPGRSHGYGEESEAGVETKSPVRNDDMKVETAVLGRDLPSGSHDQLSPEDDFNSKAEETQDPKTSTYIEQITSPTSFITEKAINAKNAVASSLGYSGETTDASSVEQTESPMGEVAGTAVEKLTPVDEKDGETRSTVTTKLPVSGGGSGAEEMEEGEDKGVSAKAYLAEKLKPGEEDKALSEIITEKLNFGGEKKRTPKEGETKVEGILSDKIPEETEHGEVITEEEKGGRGMVEKIRGTVTSWFGGATEEVKPKSPGSVEESADSTVRD